MNFSFKPTTQQKTKKIANLVMLASTKKAKWRGKKQTIFSLFKELPKKKIPSNVSRQTNKRKKKTILLINLLKNKRTNSNIFLSFNKRVSHGDICGFLSRISSSIIDEPGRRGKNLAKLMPNSIFFFIFGLADSPGMYTYINRAEQESFYRMYD